MHTEFQPEDPEVLKAMKYDRRDIKVPMLKSWTTWITGSCIVCFLVSIPVYNWLSTPGKTLPSMLGTTREMAPKSSNRIPAGYPLLQDNFSTKVDIKQLRMHEDETMSSFGWVDQNNGYRYSNPKLLPCVDQAVLPLAGKGRADSNQPAETPPREECEIGPAT
ncbi:MAG: hypothetical protein WCO91_00340 [Gemmataceae bacterium]